MLEKSRLFNFVLVVTTIGTLVFGVVIVHAHAQNYWVKPSGCGNVYMTADGSSLTFLGNQCSRMGVLGVKGNLAFVSFPMPDRGNKVQVVRVGEGWSWDGPKPPDNLWVHPVADGGQVYMTSDGKDLETLDFGYDPMGVLGVKGNLAFVSFPMPDRGNKVQVVRIGGGWDWGACKEPDGWFEDVPHYSAGGQEYISYWGVTPAGDVLSIAFYNNERDFDLNHTPPICKWPVGMSRYPEHEDGFEIHWVGEPDFINE